METSQPNVERTLNRLREAAGLPIQESRKRFDGSPVKLLREAFDRQTVSRQERSTTLAALRYGHARDVNAIARAMPDFIGRTLARHLPWMPTSLDRVGAERAIIERIFGWKETWVNPCFATQPNIIDAPFLWQDNDSHTITGTGFGAIAGTVALKVDDPPGTVVPLTVDSWSDVAVTARIPSQLPPGIPLLTFGSLWLTRGDVPCADAVSIRFEPASTLLFARIQVAEFGWAVLNAHTKLHTLTSPVLPPRAEPFVSQLLSNGDVNLSLSSTEWTDFDDPPTMAVVSGPSFDSSRRRTITVRVNDDRIWDYLLTADFFLRQPADAPVGAGWSHS